MWSKLLQIFTTFANKMIKQNSYSESDLFVEKLETPFSSFLTIICSLLDRLAYA